MTVIGCDTSSYNDAESTPQVINWGMCKAHNEFVFHRFSVGTAQDADMVLNYNGSGAVGLLRGSYHYMYFNNLDAQIALYCKLINQYPTELPPVVDYEQAPSGITSGTMRNMLKTFLEQIKIQTRRQPMIYTRASYWNLYGSADPYWLQYPLWVAHYTTNPTPLIPAPWKSYTFWQYTDKGDGKAEGMESYGLDKNRWYGTLEQLYAFAGQEAQAPLTYEQKVDRLWAAHPDLHT